MNERIFLRLAGDPLYAPETDVPVGAMHDHAVSPDLSGYVSSMITYRESIPFDDVIEERILPDGAVRLVFDLGGGAVPGGGAGPRAAVIGASVLPAVLRLHGRLEGVSIALRPGAAPAVLGIAAGEITGKVVALDQLWRGQASILLERLAGLSDDDDRVATLQTALAARLRGGGGDVVAQRRSLRALDLIGASNGRIALREVAEAVGVGERRLQQIFQAQVGLSPRAWSRLSRMHACLRLLRRRPAPRWAQAALDAGFYDQAHLVNEFRALCGLTPGLFLARRVSRSSNTAGRDRAIVVPVRRFEGRRSDGQW